MPPVPPSPDKLLDAHRAASARPLDRVGQAIDHLVDCLGGEPSVPLRRVAVLIDIARHPGTPQMSVAERQNMDKSSLTRDIDWLYNYGCISKNVNENNARESALTIVGVARTHLNRAVEALPATLESLQMLIDGYITFFKNDRATLRDAKIVTVLTASGGASRQDVFAHLYNGPASTDNRALLALIEEGFVIADGTEE